MCNGIPVIYSITKLESEQNGHHHDHCADIYKCIFLNEKLIQNMSDQEIYLIKIYWQLGTTELSNHQPHNCLLSRLFRRRSKKTSKLHVTGLCAGNSPVTGEFPAQRASNAENVSIWWHQYERWQAITWTSYYTIWHHKLQYCDDQVFWHPMVSLGHTELIWTNKPLFLGQIYFTLIFSDFVQYTASVSNISLCVQLSGRKDIPSSL